VTVKASLNIQSIKKELPSSWKQQVSAILAYAYIPDERNLHERLPVSCRADEAEARRTGRYGRRGLPLL
jgi:hypothetical protein